MTSSLFISSLSPCPPLYPLSHPVPPSLPSLILSPLLSFSLCPPLIFFLRTDGVDYLIRKITYVYEYSPEHLVSRR